MISIPVFCECGKAVPAYFYCDGCRKVNGSPNCPCGKPLKGVRVGLCPSCSTGDIREFTKKNIRDKYERATGICLTGDCTIPTCRTCKKAEAPETFCPLCMRNECSNCADKCRNDISKYKQGFLSGTKTDSTVSYSAPPRKYKKIERQRDEDRPKMFVEAWEYRKGNVIKHELTGFKKKEA